MCLGNCVHSVYLIADAHKLFPCYFASLTLILEFSNGNRLRRGSKTFQSPPNRSQMVGVARRAMPNRCLEFPRKTTCGRLGNICLQMSAALDQHWGPENVPHLLIHPENRRLNHFANFKASRESAPKYFAVIAVPNGKPGFSCHASHVWTLALLNNLSEN